MGQRTTLASRPLSEGELQILREIQELYGPQNSKERVFFSDDDEAVIFVEDTGGRAVLCAVLTNLAAMCKDGTIESRESLRDKWLVPE
jgi:hypothetical protein